MTAQFREMTNEERLLNGDAIAILDWVIKTGGEPRHIESMPGCFNAKMWACNQRFHTATTVTRNTFRFYITPQGVAFLRKWGVNIREGVQVRPYQREPSPEPVEVSRVFAQNTKGEIQEVSPADVPKFVIESLRCGSLAVSDSKLYGLSPEHILGID